jgi:hypothetical protein
MLSEPIAKDSFRLRGTSMSRLDGFSDVVFGFALTLLVVSLEVPRTYDELHSVLVGFIPFAICFLLFFAIWKAHFRFFRRYGLHDTATIWINAVLLFTVLLYVYPLKFLFTVATLHVAPGVFTSPFQLRELMIFYGAGFAAICFCLAGLYGNAWRQRVALGLNPLERTLTSIDFWGYAGDGAIGLLCCLIARLLPPQSSGYAGYGFALLLIRGRGVALISSRHIRAARARTQREAQPG